MNISKRLISVADMVPQCNTVADVGTDHGYVPIYLIKENRCKKVIAMDINSGPLNKAKNHVALYGYEDKIETRLSNGFEKLEAGDADVVVISGMGGNLIIDILDAYPLTTNSISQLVLSPHSDVELVRKHLPEIGFYIDDEKIIKDEGKFYFIISAKNTEKENFKKENIKNTVDKNILLDKKDETFKEYLLKEKSECECIYNRIKNLSGENIEIRKKDILEYLNSIEKALQCYYEG